MSGVSFFFQMGRVLYGEDMFGERERESEHFMIYTVIIFVYIYILHMYLYMSDFASLASFW